MTRCALAPAPPNGLTLSEHLFDGGRRRRRSCGRVRAWRSSRERVADASSRLLAVSPPRLYAVAAVTHAPLLTFPTRTSYAVMLHFIVCSFSSYDVLVLLYLYYLLRFHFAWPRDSLHSCRIVYVFVAWPRPLLLRLIPVCSLSDSRRIYVAL